MVQNKFTAKSVCGFNYLFANVTGTSAMEQLNVGPVENKTTLISYSLSVRLCSRLNRKEPADNCVFTLGAVNREKRPLAKVKLRKASKSEERMPSGST